jgi:uncharacterized protein YecE (DUF72 family)
MAKYFIGTSGWNYRHWKGIFYPDDLSQKNWLFHYVRYFNSVELNVTFYRMVDKSVFNGWYERTPQDFRFVIKGSRYITHIKRLKDPEKPVNLLLDNCAPLKEKLAAILWQLPMRFTLDLERLDIFCRFLSKTGLRHVFEFRNIGWFSPETYTLLKKYNYCLCIAHSGRRFPCVREITADFLYLRFHGGESLYAADYSDEQLREWADFAAKYKRRDIFAFFNNDAQAYAVKNALKLKKMLMPQK